jgi:hypothetical protein
MSTLAFWQSGLGKQKRQIGKITEQKVLQIPEGSVSFFLYCPPHSVCDSKHALEVDPPHCMTLACTAAIF